MGFCRGSMQMYYALAMAEQDSELKKTLGKLNTFLSVTPCAWASFMPQDKDADQSLDKFIRVMQDEVTDQFVYGSGSDPTQNMSAICAHTLDQQSCDAVSWYLPYADTISREAWIQMGYNSALQNVLKSQHDLKDFDKNAFDDDDFVDFTKVTGPDVYHFVSPHDTECTPETAKTLADQIPTYQKEYLYKCVKDHTWFGGRGLLQEKWMKDMVIALGMKEDMKQVFDIA